MSMADLKYTKSHEWIAVSGDVGTIGVTAFAVNLLSDLVYLDLPAVGASVHGGEKFGEVENVKAVSDLYSPVDGEVTEVNSQLPDHLDWLSHDPFGQGWMIRVRITNPEQLAGLLDHAAYTAHCESESH